MSADPRTLTENRWDALRRFSQPRAPIEQCELCSLPLPAEHQHLVDPASRKLLCACDACAILFDHQGEMKYRRVPRSIRSLPEFHLDDGQWNRLQIPIGLAFFFQSSAAGRVSAVYPSPAGPTESLLELDSWDEIVRDNRVLEMMETDTEALLVHRLGSAREHYLVPIDECYKLVGLVRRHWEGFSGGSLLWEEIERFFESLKRRDETPAV